MIVFYLDELCFALLFELRIPMGGQTSGKDDLCMLATGAGESSDSSACFN